jgi:hypothetical protein
VAVHVDDETAVNLEQVGGQFLNIGVEQYLVRGLGLVTNAADIGTIVVAERNGAPITLTGKPRWYECGMQNAECGVEKMDETSAGENSAIRTPHSALQPALAAMRKLLSPLARALTLADHHTALFPGVMA